jgi:hypothetical protein
MADVGSTVAQGAPPSLPANADLSAKQFHFMELDGGKLDVCTSQGQFMVGVLGDKPKAGEDGTLLGQPGTIVQVVAGSAGVTVDSEVTVDTASRGENAGQGDWVAGFALATATEGAQFSMLAISPYVKA